VKPDALRKLAAAGLSTEQIAVVMEIMDDDAEERRAKGRARWRKHQENKRNANVSSLQATFTANSRAGDARVEDKTSNQEIEPQEKKETPLSRLRAVLDEERARAVIDHRQRLRKALTERAAKMLAAELAKFPDPNAAADRMILKGWQTIDVAWPEAWPGAAQPRAGPQPKSRGVGGVFDDLVETMENGRQNEGAEAAGATVLRIPHRITG
jgi:hypothetical protein